MAAQLITGSDRFRFQMLDIFYQIINQLTEFISAIAAAKAIIPINHGLPRLQPKQFFDHSTGQKHPNNQIGQKQLRNFAKESKSLKI